MRSSRMTRSFSSRRSTQDRDLRLPRRSESPRLHCGGKQVSRGLERREQMLGIDYQIANDNFSEYGSRIGSLPVLPDWEPARE